MTKTSSGSSVNVLVQLEREEEVTGPVIAPFFPQVSISLSLSFLSISFGDTERDRFGLEARVRQMTSVRKTEVY